ncbi:PaaI family thioesterase [Paraburkholderia azotifigens]|nr:PaaI family thioesterase [Paraburkholderia azotifigens]
MSTPALSPSAALNCDETEFEPLVTGPGFVQTCGGFLLHRHLPVLGVRVLPAHLNAIGIAHGGFLATFADTAFGAVLRRDCGYTASPTVNLSTNYLAPVYAGEWAQAHVEIVKAGRSLAHATCTVTAGGRAVLQASGVFYLRSRPRAPSPLACATRHAEPAQATRSNETLGRA